MQLCKEVLESNLANYDFNEPSKQTMLPNVYNMLKAFCLESFNGLLHRKINFERK